MAKLIKALLPVALGAFILVGCGDGGGGVKPEDSVADQLKAAGADKNKNTDGKKDIKKLDTAGAPAPAAAGGSAATPPADGAKKEEKKDEKPAGK